MFFIDWFLFKEKPLFELNSSTKNGSGAGKRLTGARCINMYSQFRHSDAINMIKPHFSVLFLALCIFHIAELFQRDSIFHGIKRYGEYKSRVFQFPL